MPEPTTPAGAEARRRRGKVAEAEAGEQGRMNDLGAYLNPVRKFLYRIGSMYKGSIGKSGFVLWWQGLGCFLQLSGKSTLLVYHTGASQALLEDNVCHGASALDYRV